MKSNLVKTLALMIAVFAITAEANNRYPNRPGYPMGPGIGPNTMLRNGNMLTVWKMGVPPVPIRYYRTTYWGTHSIIKSDALNFLVRPQYQRQFSEPMMIAHYALYQLFQQDPYRNRNVVRKRGFDKGMPYAYVKMSGWRQAMVKDKNGREVMKGVQIEYQVKVRYDLRNARGFLEFAADLPGKVDLLKPIQKPKGTPSTPLPKNPKPPIQPWNP